MAPRLFIGTLHVRTLRVVFALTCTLVTVQPARGDQPDTPTLPAGATLAVRLLDSLVGVASARGTAVRALVIAPTTLGGRLALAPGDTVLGTVTDAGVERGRGERHFVLATFDRLTTSGRPPLRLQARVADVPNARETVDSTGRIVGPDRPGALRSRADWASLLLGTADPLAGVVFFTAFQAERVERHRRIAYEPGIELTLRLTDALPLPAWPVPRAEVAVSEAVLTTLRAAPLRAVTQKDQLPADIITLALIGTESEVTAAFEAAGWTPPEHASVRADYETLVEAARAQGFDRQPVSTLDVDGSAPQLAFEKVANSMAKRHHLRIWSWRASSDGRRIWLIAATRDDGVLFSHARRTFTHRVDPQIDVERQKIVDDLTFTGAVAAHSDLPRTPPNASVFVNDGTTAVATDWRLAVLVLQSIR